MSFHGSYRPQDVEFLLKPIQVEHIENTRQKEQLIQTGARHYSEMLSPETLPSERYLQLFAQAHAMNRSRMARDCLTLAELIRRNVGPNPTLVSLARAGTPVGAILTHLLRELTGKPIAHYSVSIIRDRGIDANALDEILRRGTDPSTIVFIDGWTGKGVITDELTDAIEIYNTRRSTHIRAHLYVLADLAGKAFCAASAEDYLIPSSILNATISGLISRSVLNHAIGPQDYHGCVYFSQFSAHDRSIWFVEDMVSEARQQMNTHWQDNVQPADTAHAADCAQVFLDEEMQRHGIQDRNLIKPGIGEATRVLLRRLPERLIVRNPEAACVQHLLTLAHEKHVRVEHRAQMPFQAVSIIRSALDA